jgi:hypothetical protein
MAPSRVSKKAGAKKTKARDFDATTDDEVEEAGETFTLAWTDLMVKTLLHHLKEQHDLGKRSGGAGFKPEAFEVFRDRVQEVYTGSEIISAEKIRSKYDYV